MSKRARWIGFISLLAVTLLVAFVVNQPTIGVAKSDKGEYYNGKVPKYVFMFIGDGMSYAQVSSAIDKKTHLEISPEAIPGFALRDHYGYNINISNSGN